jgi:hypothetical protein
MPRLGQVPLQDAGPEPIESARGRPGDLPLPWWSSSQLPTQLILREVGFSTSNWAGESAKILFPVCKDY